jgi:hypothetical protein
MAILVKTLISQLKTDNPDLARLSDPKALLAHIRDYRTVIVGGECYTIEHRLEELGGVYMPTSREWVFENKDTETLEALSELIAHKNLITLKLTNGSPSRRLSMASIS